MFSTPKLEARFSGKRTIAMADGMVCVAMKGTEPAATTVPATNALQDGERNTTRRASGNLTLVSWAKNMVCPPYDCGEETRYNKPFRIRVRPKDQAEQRKRHPKDKLLAVARCFLDRSSETYEDWKKKSREEKGCMTDTK